MIDRRQLRRTARTVLQGVVSAARHAEKEGPRLLRRAGESLHLVEPRRRLAPVGLVLGVLGTLGAVAAVGLLASAGGAAGRT